MSDDLIKRIAGHVLQADRYGAKYEGTGMGLIFDSHSRLFKDASDEIERLRAALRPFAMMHAKLNGDGVDRVKLTTNARGEWEISFKPFVKAAEIIGPQVRPVPAQSNIDYLSARETTVMAMLNDLSPEDALTKLSLEGELEQIREELKKALAG